MIRYANERDISGINNIRRQVHKLHSDGRPDIFYSDFSQLEDSVSKFLREKEFDVIVCDQDGEICGMAVMEYIYKPATLYRTDRKYVNVIEFGVDINHRRKGIGTKLFEFIKSEAKKKGYNRLELDMWSFNETALKFYESVGLKVFRRYLEMNL